MKEFIVRRDDARDIKFIGNVIGCVESSPNNAHQNYSRQVGKHSVLRLYRTKGGKYVCEKVAFSQWQGAHTAYMAAYCKTSDEVFEFFGAGWLETELYEISDLDTSMLVD